jgi:hypothetical protein
MARGGTITVESNFTKGLITEYTALNFPENAVTETDNCVYSELGAVTRRLGVDFEVGHTLHETSALSDHLGSITEFKWFSVGNQGTTTFLVQQIGTIIRFFSLDENSSVSSGLKPFKMDLLDYSLGGATADDVRNSICQFTTGDGYLFIANPFCNPLYVGYDEVSDDITTEEITIEIRDISGVDDGLQIDTRPLTLSNLHRYNLFNQGWHGLTRTTSSNSQNPLTYWDSHRSDFPSNADIFWLFRNANGEMNTNRVNEEYIGNSPAPRGHYIYPAFNIDRSTVSGILGLPSQNSGNARPSAISWYSGRVFYAGVKSPRYSSTLYFSQTVESELQFGRCYQINDPTSETNFDLIDTDGGTIELPLMEEVVALKPLNDSLIIIGTNCVYSLSGTDQGPFKATNFTLRYVGPVGGLSHLSLVESEGSLLWWNYDGIYTIGMGQNGVDYSISNISKQTIQSLVNSIPVDKKVNIKGSYNKREQIIRWIYSDGDGPLFVYDKILDLNVASQAFYTHTVDKTLGPYISGILSLQGNSKKIDIDLVVSSDNPVTRVGEFVTVNVVTYTGSQEVFKFTTISGGEFTYSEMIDQNLVDWRSFDTIGVGYDSSFTSGYRIRGELLRAFNATPIAFLIKNVPDGSLLVSGIWDYGFRESIPHQLYLTRPEVSNIIRRIKIRGKGKSLQLRFQSVGNSPFNIAGWASLETGGTQP